MNISGYIACHNNAEYLEAAITSLLRQTRCLSELLVIDDGSTDGSGDIARQLGARVIRHPQSLGRGAARARAFAEASGDLLLGLDGTSTIDRDFLERALGWFDLSEVAGVYARIVGPPPVTVVDRWRSRHLFKESSNFGRTHKASLITAACVLRRKAVMEVGNFAPECRHSEDAELGRRLLAAGWDVIGDASLTVTAKKRDTLASVLERFGRWHVGLEPKLSLRGWWKMLGYTVKVMIRRDLQARDPLSAGISLLVPYYQVWCSVREIRLASRGRMS